MVRQLGTYRFSLHFVAFQWRTKVFSCMSMYLVNLLLHGLMRCGIGEFYKLFEVFTSFGCCFKKQLLAEVQKKFSLHAARLKEVQHHKDITAGLTT